MAYKFQFGTARMSGALEQEGNVTIATGSSDVIGVESSLGSKQFLAQLKFDGTAGVESAVLELVSGSGDVNFYAGEKLSGSALATLAGAALDFNQSSGIMDVTNSGIAGLISEATINVGTDSIVYYDASGVLQRDSLADYATALAAGNGIQAGGGALAIDISEFGVVAPANGDSLLTLDSDGSTEQRTTIAALASLFAGDGLGATNSVMEVQVSGAVKVASDKVGITGSIAGDGLSFAGGADSISSLAVDINELTAATIDVANDSFAFIDANDSNASRKESFEDYATAIAGAGIAASSGVLAVGAGSLIDVNANDVAVDLTEAGAATIAHGDHLIFLDGGASGTAAKGSTEDLASLLDGSGLSRTDSTLSVAVSGAVHISSDKVSITGSIAGNGLAFGGGANSISELSLDLNELTAGTVADGDFFTFIDTNDSNATKKEAIADLASLFAGAGMTATNSVMNVIATANGGLGVSANSVGLDMDTLSVATINVADDSFAFVDADDDTTKKDTIADLVTAMAGAGLTATNGVLSVQANSMNVFNSAGPLSEGYNVQNATTAMAMTLPEGSAGDVVVVKAGNLSAGAVLTINKHGTQNKQMDGEDSLEIESPFGALTLVYASDAVGWRIV